jgi:hypothetical protein
VGVIGAIFGFLGSVITNSVQLLAIGAGLTAVVILWRADAIPPLIGLIGTGLGGFFNGLVAAFGFLTALISSVL